MCDNASGCNCGGMMQGGPAFNTPMNTPGIGNPVPAPAPHHGCGSGDKFVLLPFPVAVKAGTTSAGTTKKKKKKVKKHKMTKKSNKRKTNEAMYNNIMAHVSRTVIDALNEYVHVQPEIEGYYMCSVGDEDDESDAAFAYRLYDMLTHNEITPSEAIDRISDYFDGTLDVAESEEKETISNKLRLWGYDKDEKYGLFYEDTTGTFFVYRLSAEYTEVVKESYDENESLVSLQKTIAFTKYLEKSRLIKKNSYRN